MRRIERRHYVGRMIVVNGKGGPGQCSEPCVPGFRNRSPSGVLIEGNWIDIGRRSKWIDDGRRRNGGATVKANGIVIEV